MPQFCGCEIVPLRANVRRDSKRRGSLKALPFSKAIPTRPSGRINGAIYTADDHGCHSRYGKAGGDWHTGLPTMGKDPASGASQGEPAFLLHCLPSLQPTLSCSLCKQIMYKSFMFVFSCLCVYARLEHVDALPHPTSYVSC